MMLLALESSAEVASVALCDGGRLFRAKADSDEEYRYRVAEWAQSVFGEGGIFGGLFGGKYSGGGGGSW